MAYPTGELIVDLRAIAENWSFVRSQLSDACACGAVVKANAYGLGVERVAPILYEQGCREFFVANFKEAMQLRSLIGLDAEIYVLAGCNRGAESTFIEKDITPVIVSLEMFQRWLAVCKSGSHNAKSALKINTGMARLGLEDNEYHALLANPESLKRAGVRLLTSHLACSDQLGHELNRLQLQRFSDSLSRLRSHLPDVRASLANSGGVFLGSEFHFDLVRPGVALYGGLAGEHGPSMQGVAGLRLPILQIRKLNAGATVGYGATASFDTPRVIATVAGGYADGVLRSLSNRGFGFYKGCKVPLVGRVSMDSTMFDVTEVFEGESAEAGLSIELLGDNVSVDDLAKAADTISYEVLTSLGSRFQRSYFE